MHLANICPCAETERLPRLCAFIVGFEKVIKSCLLLLATLLGLIYTHCTFANLKVPPMIFYDGATKVLGTDVFPRHNIADLNPAISLFVLFSHENPLR